MAQFVNLQVSDVTPGQVILSAEDYSINLATIKATGKQVAVKMYQQSQLHKNEDVAVIMEEVRKLVALPSNPGFVAYLGAYVNAGMLHVVRDYVDGEDFSKIIPKHSLSVAEIKAIGAKICDNLRFLHEKNVYNYNIKPDNVILKADKSIVLCDYAMLELRESLQRKGTSSRRADIAVAPPEVFRSGQYAQEKSDVYSIGLILWMLNAKKIPKVRRFDTKTIADPSLKEILSRVLNQDPEERPNLVELRAALSS